MSRNSRTSRCLLTAALAFSLAVAGLLPRFAEPAIGGGRPSSADSSAKSCCCGTQAGSCCGMGCCTAREAPTPERGPAPIPEGGPNARLSALASVWSQVCLPMELLVHRAWDRDGDAVDRSLAEATLQAKQVRLDA